MPEEKRTYSSNGSARPAQRPSGSVSHQAGGGTRGYTSARIANDNGQRPAGARSAQRPTDYRGQRPPQRSGGRPPVRRRKKKRATGRFAAFLLIVVLLIVGVLVLMPKLKGGAPIAAQTPQPDENTSIGAQTEPGDDQAVDVTAQANATVSYETKTLKTTALSQNTALDGTWRSILLLGTDARLWDDMKHTDTMIVACYNTKTGAVRLISVMRDAFVDIPQKSGTVRLNTVMAYGGPEQLITTLNEKLGLNISEYMLVDFNGFREVVDILGGLDIDLTEVEMQYINSGLVEQVNLLVDKRYRQSTLEACTLTSYGPQTHLNGLQALAYARIRKSDSDYKRTERQRTVIMAAANKAIDSMTIVQVTQIAGSMLQYVETNIPLTSLLTLGAQVMSTGIADLKETRIPVNDSFTGETRNNVWGMYDVKWETNKAEVQSLLYGY